MIDTYPTVQKLTDDEIAELKNAERDYYERQLNQGTAADQIRLYENVARLNRKQRRRAEAMKKAAPVSKSGLS